MRMTPLVTTPGKVMPALPDQPNSATRPRTASATAFGPAGCGVGTLIRSLVRLPMVTSTGAALIPEPPMSIPRTSTAPSLTQLSVPAAALGQPGYSTTARHSEAGGPRRRCRRAAPGRPSVRPMAHIISSAGWPVTVTTGVCALAVILTCCSPGAAGQVVPGQLHPHRRAAEERACRAAAAATARRPGRRLSSRGCQPSARAPDVLVVDEELHHVDPLIHAGHAGRATPRGGPVRICPPGCGNGVPWRRAWLTRRVWPASGPPIMPAAASGRRSLSTRCAARSPVRQPSHSVGASGPGLIEQGAQRRRSSRA